MKKILIYSLLVINFFSILFIGGWYFTANQLKKLIENSISQVNEEKENNLNISYDKITYLGFPSYLGLKINNLRLKSETTESNNIEASIGDVEFFISYSGKKIEAYFSDKFDLNTMDKDNNIFKSAIIEHKTSPAFLLKLSKSIYTMKNSSNIIENLKLFYYENKGGLIKHIEQNNNESVISDVWGENIIKITLSKEKQVKSYNISSYIEKGEFSGKILKNLGSITGYFDVMINLFYDKSGFLDFKEEEPSYTEIKINDYIISNKHSELSIKGAVTLSKDDPLPYGNIDLILTDFSNNFYAIGLKKNEVDLYRNFFKTIGKIDDKDNVYIKISRQKLGELNIGNINIKDLMQFKIDR